MYAAPPPAFPLITAQLATLPLVCLQTSLKDSTLVLHRTGQTGDLTKSEHGKARALVIGILGPWATWL